MTRGSRRPEMGFAWEDFHPLSVPPLCQAYCPLLREIEPQEETSLRQMRDVVAEDWSEDLRAALRQLTTTIKASEVSRMDRLEQRITELEDRPGPIIVPINTFAPEPYAPTADAIHAVVTPVEDGYVASVHDVNVGASGDTVLEATENLKELLVFTLEDLSEEPPERLGKRAALQLHALRAIIKRVG